MADGMIGFEDVLDNVFEREDTGNVVNEDYARWLGRDQS